MSTNASDPTVLFLSGDLVFASRVRGAAEAAGFRFQLSGKFPEDGGEAIRYVVVDLSTRSGVVDGLPECVAAQSPGARIIAYGPHVQTARLEAARQAGIPTVLTRGQFDRQLPSLFAS
jgi:hypothetical protein